MKQYFSKVTAIDIMYLDDVAFVLFLLLFINLVQCIMRKRNCNTKISFEYDDVIKW